MKNKYDINGDIVTMYLNRRKTNETIETIFDLKYLDKVMSLGLSWYPSWVPAGGVYYVKSTKYIETIDGKAKYKLFYLHRFILDETGNNNPLNNLESNLRVVSQAKNTKNRNGANSNNTSGHRNVSFIHKYYRVQLQIDGKNHIFPEHFNDPNEAGIFAEAMRLKYYGEFKGCG